jgi:hypothetical protein
MNNILPPRSTEEHRGAPRSTEEHRGAPGAIFMAGIRCGRVFSYQKYVDLLAAE